MILISISLNSFKKYNYYEQVAKNLELDNLGKKNHEILTKKTKTHEVFKNF